MNYFRDVGHWGFFLMGASGAAASAWLWWCVATKTLLPELQLMGLLAPAVNTILHQLKQEQT
jgi:hypothetical protein